MSISERKEYREKDSIPLEVTKKELVGQSRDEYFLESGDKIRYFLEEDAIDTDDRLVVDKSRCLNKVPTIFTGFLPSFTVFSFVLSSLTIN